MLVVLGLALLAFLVGALASMNRSDISASQVATQPPAEASRTAKAPASETEPYAETISRPEAGPDLSGREARDGSIVRADAPVVPSGAAPIRSEPPGPSPIGGTGDAGEAVVRAFYGALGRGNGEEASAHVVAEKRSSRAFSPQAISRFYGELREPLRLTAIEPLARGAYRVSYRYSAGRSRCDGEAVVSLTSRDGRDFIRSIRALNDC